MKVDQKKFRELVLYLSAKSILDSKFGATKLNKLLFFCDFVSYVDLGKPITGASYFRLGMGPAPRCLVPVRREMVEQGLLQIKRVQLPDNKCQERTVALRAPNMMLFTGEEIELINKIVETLWNHDANDVSDLSHQEVGWKVMRDQETIPYELAFFSNPPLTSDETARAKEIAELRRAA